MWCIKYLLVSLCLTCHSTWGYEVTITMDPYDKFNVTWNYKEGGDKITFTVSCATTGWVGLGFSPKGAMTGSDIVFAWVTENGTVTLQDRYAESNSAPLLDESQDVTLVSGSESDGVTTVTFTRPLKSCDKGQDWEISKTDTVRLIWAYGSSDPINEEVTGALYHSSNRGTKSVYLLDEPSKPQSIPADSKTFDMTVNTTIPSNKTTYYCLFIEAPELNEKNHVVAVEPIVQPGNEGFVHHIVVHACNGLDKMHLRNSNKTEGSCFTAEMPEFAGSCREPAFVWAVGGNKFFYPEHTGYALGAEDSPEFFMLEMHYDNPQQIEGQKDTSGMTITYTPSVRKYDVGALSVGAVPSIFVPPETKNFNVYGYCSDSCTKNMVPEGGLNFFGYLLHAHLLGSGIKVSWYRDGKELPPLAQDNAYDFNFQENRLFQEEKTFLPGDSLKVTCTMNSKTRKVMTFGGLGTPEEMCIGYMMYYPKLKAVYCGSEAGYLYDANHTLWKDLNIKPVTKGRPSVDLAQSFSQIVWNDENRRIAQKVVDETYHISACFREVGQSSNSTMIILPPDLKIEPYINTEYDACDISSNAPGNSPKLVTIIGVLMIMKMHWI